MSAAFAVHAAARVMAHCDELTCPRSVGEKSQHKASSPQLLPYRQPSRAAVVACAIDKARAHVAAELRIIARCGGPNLGGAWRRCGGDLRRAPRSLRRDLVAHGLEQLRRIG